jgi:uncharacterized protein (TIGR02594 family)
LNPKVRAYFKYTRFPAKLVNKKTAWCAAALCAWLERAGIRSPRSARAADFRTYGAAVALADAQPGDIVYFPPHNPDAGGSGHITVFEAWETDALGKLLCLGGNQSNSVCVKTYGREGAEVRRPPGALRSA